MSGGMGGNDAGVDPPTTTKGDLSGFDTTFDRVPIGVDSTVLTADSTEALGLKWAASAGATLPIAQADVTNLVSDLALKYATGIERSYDYAGGLGSVDTAWGANNSTGLVFNVGGTDIDNNPYFITHMEYKTGAAVSGATMCIAYARDPTNGRCTPLAVTVPNSNSATNTIYKVKTAYTLPVYQGINTSQIYLCLINNNAITSNIGSANTGSNDTGAITFNQDFVMGLTPPLAHGGYYPPYIKVYYRRLLG